MRAPFANFVGIAAAMPMSNINTDSIIPASWMRTAHADLGKGLFGCLRYDEAGREQPNFVLNREPFRSARILVVGENFGCGSSREAAVWALVQFGICCILAPSFADIFYENAFRNGLLAGLIERHVLEELTEAIAIHGQAPFFELDLRAATIAGPDGRMWSFGVSPSRRDALIRGGDEIDSTMRHMAAIASFYTAARAERAWLYPDLDRKISTS